MPSAGRPRGRHQAYHAHLRATTDTDTPDDLLDGGFTLTLSAG
ncbi:hypothetical protein ACW4TU_43560 [Streptomyces sp. QTS52]